MLSNLLIDVKFTFVKLGNSIRRLIKCYNIKMQENSGYKSMLAIPYKPLVLIILDGFGVNTHLPDSTWQHAKRPTFEELEKFYPFTTLQASGPAVGLPWQESGNSEVGHLTIGSGRVIYTHLPRIIVAIEDGSFFENKALINAASHVKKNSSALHLIGLFSTGSVHAYVEHIYALLDFALKQNIERVFLHIFTDGRDAPPEEAGEFLRKFVENGMPKYPFASVVSVIGRHFAMDRDGNWDRICAAYNLLTAGIGEPYDSAAEHIEKQYAIGVTDEFITPGFLKDGSVGPAGRIKENDAVIFFNFREDSARELTEAFIADSFDRFGRLKIPNLFFVTMTRYSEQFNVEVAFPPLDVSRPLAKVISDSGLKQLHVAETEKYAHVTYFFNGGEEKPFPGEDRNLIPSLKGARYDQHPEMAAKSVAATVVSGVGEYDFILANLANTDMVGHTGNFEATVRAIEYVDEAVGVMVPAVLKAGGAVLIISDHGNAEEKRYTETGRMRTKHTANPVPFWLVADGARRIDALDEPEIKKLYLRTEGVLSDVAPTILELMNLKKPEEMNGLSLLPKLFKKT